MPALLILAMVAGTLVFWVGIPALVLWALAQVLTDGAQHFVAAVVVVPAAMTAFAPLLLWLDSLYLRVTGAMSRQPGSWRRPLHGPLENILVVTLVISVVALFVWFFLFAENPQSQVF